MVVSRNDYIRCISHYFENCSSIAYPALKYKPTKQFLWINACHNPSRVDIELDDTTHKKIIHTSSRSRYVADEITAFNSTLKSFSKTKDLHKGRKLHQDILKQGLVARCLDALVGMYVKCSALNTAKELLYGHKSKNVSSWTALITGYARLRQGQEALNCFRHMQHEGLSPDAVTFTSLLKACGTIQAAEKGKQIHDEIARQGLLENDIVVGTAVVDMYAKCGNLVKAQYVLDELPSRNVITWSALIARYAEQGQGEQALICFEHMKHEGLTPNAVTFISVLKACGSIGAAEKGEQLHDEIVRQDLLRDNHALGTALVNMYAKCGALDKAQIVLEELPSRNAITWSALIAACTQQGHDEQALSCFKRLQDEGLSPTSATFSCILKACGSLKAVDKGEQIHYEITRRGLLQNDHVLGTAVVDMYAKCGALSIAQKVLEELPSRYTSMWTALIAGYAQHGQGEQALTCFERMQCEGLSPNAITLSCILNACSHLGLVEDCFGHYTSMRYRYGVEPDLEHAICMVDLFGRAGHLDRATKQIVGMPSSNHPVLWYALMGACRKWADVNVGRWAFEHAVQLNGQDAGAYILMANIYAAAGMRCRSLHEGEHGSGE